MNMHKDKTNELFRAKLTHFEWQGDIPDWEELQLSLHLAQIESDGKRTMRYRRRLVGWCLGMAALLTGLLMGYWRNEGGHFNTPLPESASAVYEAVPIELFSSEQVKSLLPIERVLYTQAALAQIDQIQEPANESVQEVVTQDVLDTTSEKQIPAILPEELNSPLLVTEYASLPKRKHTPKSAFSMGLLASNFSINSKQTPVVRNASLSARPPHSASDSDGKITESLDKHRFSGFDHNLPIRVGITAGYELIRRLSIESGIVYSYHHSRFSMMDGARVQGTQKLHFLGIPVNLIYRLIDNEMFSLYLGAGAEMNVNLYAKQHYDFSGHPLSASYRQEQPIWGTGVKAGAAYRIFKQCELYLEPGLMKYWSKGDLHTRWTDEKLAFNLNFGIRTLF